MHFSDKYVIIKQHFKHGTCLTIIILLLISTYSHTISLATNLITCSYHIIEHAQSHHRGHHIHIIYPSTGQQYKDLGTSAPPGNPFPTNWITITQIGFHINSWMLPNGIAKHWSTAHEPQIDQYSGIAMFIKLKFSHRNLSQSNQIQMISNLTEISWITYLNDN